MKGFLSSIFLVGLFGLVLGGVGRSPRSPNWPNAYASSSDGTYSPGSSFDPSGEDDFNSQELGAPIKSQHVVSVDSFTDKSTTTTGIPADEEDFPDIDFSSPRRSFLARAGSFITKQFGAIWEFLKRIWGQFQAFIATSSSS